MTGVSVIIPNFNHAPYLRERIASVLAQTVQPAEIILLDDASSDKSAAILEEYRNHPLVSHFIINEQNSGSPFKQWEKGLQLARHNWIWIAESDDTAEPLFLENAIAQLTAQPGAGLYFCNAIVETEDGLQTTAEICKQRYNSAKWEQSFSQPGRELIDANLQFHPVILNASAVVFNKQLLQKTGTQLSRFHYYGDWYAWIAVLAESTMIYDANCYCRFRRTSFSHSERMSYNNLLKVKEDCFRIASLLLQLPSIKNKDQLVRTWVRDYIGFGFRTEGFGKVIKICSRYLMINFKLALRVFLLKLTGRAGKQAPN